MKGQIQKRKKRKKKKMNKLELFNIRNKEIEKS